MKAGLKLVYDKEIRIYENLSAFPRAFVTYPTDAKAGSIIAEKALIKEYRANRAVIEAEAEKTACSCLPMFTGPDGRPMNGVEAKIMPVEGIARAFILRKAGTRLYSATCRRASKRPYVRRSVALIMLALAFSDTALAPCFSHSAKKLTLSAVSVKIYKDKKFSEVNLIMPIYEYKCNDCGKEFEVMQKFSDQPLKACVHCSGKKVENSYQNPRLCLRAADGARPTIRKRLRSLKRLKSLRPARLSQQSRNVRAALPGNQ